MFVHGTECSIVIKTTHLEKDIPYFDETLRDDFLLLQEEASIEGDGVCRGLRKNCGVTGCVVTPLTIGIAPLLLYVAMGAVEGPEAVPVFVSGSRNVYQYALDLMPMENCRTFDLVQDRCGTSNNEQVTINKERKMYEGCRVKGFELRVMRGEAVKLKLDVSSESASRAYPREVPGTGIGERFNGDFVTYRINGKEYKNIYGITLVSKKESGTKTEIYIKRVLEKGGDIPAVIEELVITAKLRRDMYEYRRLGLFRITLKRLVLVSDETEVNAVDTVIGPLRYYVAGGTGAEVFTEGGEVIN